MSEVSIDALNRAFGSRTGDTPRFTAEAEGDDYLFGRPPRAVDVHKALRSLDDVGGDLEQLDPESLDTLARAAAEVQPRTEGGDR